MQEGNITMSQTELSRLEVIQKVSNKELNQKGAAQLLGLSVRQIKRLIRDYKQRGAVSVVSTKRGKPSNRRHKKEFKEEVVGLVKVHYSDFGPTLASEKLGEREKRFINKETLRQWMIEGGLWNEKERKKGVLHQQRTRRSCRGELVQIDGSHHDWFEGRADKCCLLVFIDDATSELLALRFESSETTLGYFTVSRDYFQRLGRPLAFYSDKHGVFRINAVEAQRGTGETQFGRAMRELDIQLIFASTPEAKGRVERVNATLQDRLVKELRLQGINDMATANAFLPSYIEAHNKRFAVEAASSIEQHRRALPSEEVLARIFTVQTERIVSKQLEISYQNVIYQIQTKGQGYRLRHATITLCDDQKGDVTLLHRGSVLNYKTLDKKNKVAEAISRKELQAAFNARGKSEGRCAGHKPSAHHPWRQYEKVAQHKEMCAAA